MRRRRRGEVGQGRVLEQPVCHVDAQPGGAAVEPEPDDLLEIAVDRRVAPVPVGLALVEQVQVPLAGPAVRFGDPRPRRAVEDRLPVVGRLVAARAAPVPEDEHLALGAAGRGGQRRAEGGMLGRAVVRHEVHDHPDAVLSRRGDQLVEAGQRPEAPVHVAVIADVVAAVRQRGRVERRHPDGVHPELRQIRQARAHAGEIPDAVAVRIREASRVHLVDNRLLPPRMIGAHGGHRLLVADLPSAGRLPLCR